MDKIRELGLLSLIKWSNNYLLLVGTFFIIYFIFNLFDGDRGFISYINKKKVINELKLKEIELNNQVENLERKNLLITDKIDLDFIETLIRDKFMYGKEEDKVYIINNNDS